jgi:hypothetical protein
MRTLLAACLLSSLAVSGRAAGQPDDLPPRPDEAQAADPTGQRHLGLYIRPDVGFGYMSMSASGGGPSIGRVAATLGIAVGSAVSENNLIAFHIWSSAIGNPSGSASPGQFDKFFALTGFGFEYTAYSSQNFYFSISPSVTHLHLYNVNDTDPDKDSNWGLGARLGVGKEWWVADHWGVGVVAHLSGSVNYDALNRNVNAWWSTWTATIAFSATYN